VTIQVSLYQKGKTNQDFTDARDSEWQWHQLGYMQICTSLQTDNHASIPPPLSFLHAACGNKAIAIQVTTRLYKATIAKIMTKNRNGYFLLEHSAFV